MSQPEELFAFQLRAVGIPFEREVVFAPGRKWRADFIVMTPSDDERLLIEIDGGTWTQGRHTTGSGFERDCEKLNAAVLAGYRVLRFTPSMVDSGAALRVVEEVLK